jgi:single-stranded DNA-binding protein
MLHLLASGKLIADPQRREGAKGSFSTAAIRAEDTVVSLIAFQDAAARLLELAKGDAIAVSGQARLTSWTGRHGTEKHGISLVAEQLISTKPLSRTAREAKLRRSHRHRSTARQRANGSFELADDPVDDLWLGGAQ